MGGRTFIQRELDLMNPLMMPPGVVNAPPRPAERVRGPPAFPSQKRRSRTAAKLLREQAEAEAKAAAEAEAAGRGLEDMVL